MKNIERKKILEDLINFSKPIKVLEKEIENIPWDSEEEIVTFTQGHIKNVINKLDLLELNSNEVEDWANLIEGREDIGFDNPFTKEELEKLANPTLWN